MNAIKNYLDNMFRNLPNTEEVRRAKSELLQMMEDKYEELISEGKSENEAVGIVISEFGNLDELAESLGITEAVTENPDESKPMLSLDRVKEYLAMINKRSILLPLAIALCIISVITNVIADFLPVHVNIIGVGGMFGVIAVAVGLFIYTGIENKKYAEIKNKECSLSIETAEYVRNERKSYKSTYKVLASLGIALCIVSIINPMILNSFPFLNSNLGTILFFFFVAFGVFLITSANTKMDGYDRLLELNEAGKMSETFVPKEDRKVNKAPIIIASVAVLVIAVITFVCGIIIPGIKRADKWIWDITNGGDIISISENLYSTQGVSELTRIEMEVDVCSVDITSAEGEGLISVDYSGNENLCPEVSYDNGTLKVSQRDTTSIRLGGSFNNPRLKIVVGKDTKIDRIEMNIDAGDIDMNDVNVVNYTGDFDAGNIEISGCTFDKLELEADAGNISMDNSSAENINIKSDAGNVEIKSTDFTDFEADVDFGNVEIEDVKDLDSYDIDCEVEVGLVQVGDHSKGTKYNSDGNGDGCIRINVDAGNIEIDE
ncbi:MAG: DUF4097 domain-containing protein [Saccharofermentans sp.]|nr:DUF4097 domain-containing protein [Saccharofermentans sp.]